MFGTWSRRCFSASTSGPDGNAVGSKMEHDRGLRRLCSAGRLSDALLFMEGMVERKVPLSHYTLSALLNGSVRSKQPQRWLSIWNALTVDHAVAPNVASYLMAATASSHCGDAEAVHRLISELKTQCGLKSMRRTFDWNQLLDALRRIGDVDAVMTEYEAMTAPPDHYTISIVLSAAIKSGRFEDFEATLSRIMDSEHLRQCVNAKVVAVALDGLIRSERVHLVESVWTALCAAATDVDSNCFGLALMAAQRAQNEPLCDELVAAVKRRCPEELKRERLCWNRILTAYGHLERFDKMWTEYEAMKAMEGILFFNTF